MTAPVPASAAALNTMTALNPITPTKSNDTGPPGVVTTNPAGDALNKKSRRNLISIGGVGTTPSAPSTVAVKVWSR